MTLKNLNRSVAISEVKEAAAATPQETVGKAMDTAAAVVLPSAFRGRPLALLLAALGLLAVFYSYNAPTKLAHYTDPVIYLSGAQSIAEGHGYRFATHLGTPKVGCHPPLQSAYLAAFWRLNPNFPASVPLLYFAMVLAAFSTFTLFYAYAIRHGVAPLVAALLIVAWGVAMPWCALLYSFMSDILFGTFAVGLALYWSRVTDATSWRAWLVTGVIVTLMYLTRTAASAAAAVLGVIAVIQSRKSRTVKPLLAYGAPLLPAIVLWKWWGAGTPSYGEYIRFRIEQQGGWSGALREACNSSLSYISGLDVGHSLFPGVMNIPSGPALNGTTWSTALTVVTLLLCWAMVIACLIGCWRARTPVQRVCGIVVAAYIVQLCLYPAHLAERAMYPILPLLVVWARFGIAALPRWIDEARWPKWALVGFIASSAVANALSCAKAMDYLDQCSQPQELREAGDWLRTNSPPEAIVAATLSEPLAHFHSYSGRRVVENFLHDNRELKFSVARHSIPQEPHADFVLLCWYSPLTLDDFKGYDLELAFASSNRKYRL